MQQRQLRLGDVLDDYCPRERRITNHAIVAMVGSEVKQTRCTACDSEHEYKHARVPRQRRKAEAPAALRAHVVASAPKRVVPEPLPEVEQDEPIAPAVEPEVPPAAAPPVEGSPSAAQPPDLDEGPVHRPLIRATLPRPEGQPPPRPAPEFTVRQSAGRAGRFRPRPYRGVPTFHGDRSGNTSGGGLPRTGGRPPFGRPGKRRKRSK
jgi:hypothetical protein